MPTLSIHADRDLVPAGAPHTVMLYPFWGKPQEDPADPNTGRFDRYASFGTRFFRIASLDEAEVTVLPSDWGHVAGEPAAVEAARQLARRSGKPMLVFFVSDSDDPVELPHSIVFRTSLYRSRRGPAEFAQPAWSEDFVERYADGTLTVRSKARKPTVGFCGLAPRVWLARFRGAGLETSIRARALARLRRTKGIETNFVVREQFLGGAVEEGVTDVQKLRLVRREYVENVFGSDYVLCARGAGNFSYRFYETLSCGRIPVLVDTDCVLPYDFAIDWKEYVVWVDAADIDEIGERVLEFHERLGEDGFETLQRECRRVWERYLRPEGFFENLPRHLSLAARASVGSRDEVLEIP